MRGKPSTVADAVWWGVDRALDSLPCSTAKDSGWEPDGVTLQVRFCEEPGTNRCMAEILRHRRETRRQTDKANVCLNVGKNPAYFPTTVLRCSNYRFTLTAVTRG